MIFKKILMILLIFGGPFWVFAQGEQDYSYKVGPKDLLKINVFNVPELDITVRVSEDGTVTLPLLGNIRVNGLTRVQLEKRLQTLLESKYLKNAQVTVFIQEYQSKKVSVMGAVNKPGDFELVGRITLLQILSMAEGLAGNASDRIVVIRQQPGGKSSSLVISKDDLMIKGDPKLNIPMMPGDIVNVPPEETVDIYVMGQVKNPGVIKLKKFGGTTLLRAIAQAGGFSDRARKSGVLVTRTIDGKEKKVRINVRRILSGKKPDFILQQNDVVFVPESIL